MAKSYSERNAESIAKYGKSLYERRIEAATARGLSRSQARGHARASKGEQPASVIAPKATRYEPPKITKRAVNLPSGTKVVPLKSTSVISKYLNSPNYNKPGKRVYFQIFNPSTGNFTTMYFGGKHRGSTHGMSINEFLRRVNDRKARGLSDDDAIRETLAEDSADNSGIDSPETEGVEIDFSYAVMYIN